MKGKLFFMDKENGIFAENKALAQQARNANLVNFFASAGYTLTQNGTQIYVKEIPTLVINSATNAWYNHYTKEGSYNAIDCLVNNLKMNFKQAVAELTGNEIKSGYVQNEKTFENNSQKSVEKQSEIQPPKIPYRHTETPSNELIMPEKCDKMSKVFAYLIQSRKIPFEVVGEFAKQGLLYQSQQEITANIKGIPQTFTASNAVFVHKNENGKVVGGEIQGLNTQKRYKGIVTGTKDSAFIFVPKKAQNGEIKQVFIFESAIDLMSFYSMLKQNQIEKGTAFLSMAGLKPTVPKKFEEQGAEIFSFVDNDIAGKNFNEENNFKAVNSPLIAENVKDWNEFLMLNKDENPQLDLREILKNDATNEVNVGFKRR